MSGLERDFNQGDLINPESIAFLILKNAYLKLKGVNDKAADVMGKMQELCSTRRPSPACGFARERFAVTTQ
jgi:hypothetical protein